ncbi:cation transporter [Christensenellaceae bacterium 44-20]|jgi:copper chaperone CopZ
MKKVYRLEELDCANCAAKMERAINELPGVEKATVNFMAQKLVLTAEESRYQEILQKVEEAIRRVEPDCRIVK